MGRAAVTWAPGLQLFVARHMAAFPRHCLHAGAGVGKGRQIAALIKQHWADGGRRALWVSVSADLRVDAARDLADVKADHIPICPRVSGSVQARGLLGMRREGAGRVVIEKGPAGRGANWWLPAVLPHLHPACTPCRRAWGTGCCQRGPLIAPW